MDKIKIEEFVKSYADAVEKVDIKRIASHFHERFTLSTKNDYWYIVNNDEFQSNLAQSFAEYKKLGTNFCRIIKCNIIEFQSNHCIVNIEWGLFDNDSHVSISFDISYCIKEINHQLKYIFVIDHNEIERIAAAQA